MQRRAVRRYDTNDRGASIMIKAFAATTIAILLCGFADIGSNDLSDRPRRNPCGRAIRLQGRVSRSRRPGKTESDGERDGLFRRVRQERKLHRARRRQGPVGADPAQCRTGRGPALSQSRSATARAAREVVWTVYDTGPRKAKNVILFIGDGLSPAHRVAARHAFEGDRGGQEPSASSPSTTCRIWRWWRPPAPIPSSPIRRIR